MSFVQAAASIQVDMQVSRYRTFPGDGMVEIWGHVGDYEVCIHLSLEDACARGLLKKKGRSTADRAKTEKNV